jgi:ABC-type branched-subunit amino acid transport system ATPase component/ABC-type branched-subunit amino acid transport system permease subunit
MAGSAARPARERAFLQTQAYGRIRQLVLGGLSIAILGVMLGWPFITDYYSYNASYYNGLVAFAAISAILTISLNLSMGFSGLLSLLHSGLLLLGAYTVGSLTVKAGWPWLLGTAMAILLGAAFAAFVVAISLRATYLYFGMITLAAGLILVEIGRAWTEVTGGVVGISGVRPRLDGEVMPKTTFYYVVVLALILTYVVQRNLVRSGVGRAAMAVRESSDTASAMGIWPARTKITMFAICGGIGGFAGALYSLQLGFINPEVGLLENGLIFFVGLFLGGIATLVGPLFGVAAITLVLEAIKDYGRFITLILGTILLLSMVVIPRGIVGTWNNSRFGRDILDEDDAVGPVGDIPDSVPEVPPLEPGAAAVEGRGLIKHFGGVAAVDGIDLRVLPGAIHGIIGPNGSGKSTLVSCLTRYHKLDHGEVDIFGEPAPRSPHAVAAAGVTRVFQVPHLFERVSVIDNVLTGMRMRETYSWVGAVLRSPRYRRQDAANRGEALELLRFAGLAGRARWLASSLSHGQKRLLEVVRAVATQPKVLILDEPATGLTAGELVALGDLCRALRDRGIAVLLIEHNVQFVMGLCENVTVMESGRVIEQGPPEQVRASPAVIEAYLGRPDLVEETTS